MSKVNKHFVLGHSSNSDLGQLLDDKISDKCFSNAFRSSVKYNIPARTLRDWMKRMNIKSVFTHNNGSTSSSEKSLVHKGGEPGFKTGSSLDLRNNSTESNDCSDISSVASSSNNSESSTTASVFPDAQLKVTLSMMNAKVIPAMIPTHSSSMQVTGLFFKRY